MHIAPDKRNIKSCNIFLIAGLVAQFAARPSKDQEVAGPTPAGSATFFHGS